MAYSSNEALKDTAQPNFDDELASFVEQEYERRQAERKPFELQWRLNKEFMDGNQYLDIDPVTQTLQEIPRLYWYQEREVFNQISTIVETRIAKVSRQRPIMKVRPASNDDEDISTAKISSSLLNTAWYDQEMDEIYGGLIAWLELTGTCFLKPVWNPNKGRIIYQEETQEQMSVQSEEPLTEPITDQVQDQAQDQLTFPDQAQSIPQTQPTTSEESELQMKMEAQERMGNDPFFSNLNQLEIREGDIETVVVPPYQLFPNSSYLDCMEDLRSIIHARVFHVDEIEEMWGVRVEPEESEVMRLEEMRSGLGGVGYTVGGWRGGYKKIKDHAVLKEYYERPSKKFPKGRFIVVAGHKTLYAGPIPYMIGKDSELELPFIQIKAIPNPGVFWGKSIIERMIPVQRRYNALRNRKAEYLNLVAVGQWFEPIGSVDDDTELNNSPGNRIRYRPGIGQPQPVQFPNLPNSFENEVETLLSEFTAISGVSQLSRYSEAPSGVKSGVALSIADEQDDTRISMTTSRIAAGIIQLGKYWLALYRQFVDEPRMLRSVGANREIELMQWTASDLRSDDVIIENISALSETPAQRRQMVFDLINTGLFNKPENMPFTEEGRQKIMEILEFGNWEHGVTELRNLQVSRAKRENAEIMKGTPMPIMDFDDHQLHIEEHNRFRMSPEWEQIINMPDVGPILYQIMQEHLDQHYQAIAQAQARQMEQQLQFQQMQAQVQAQSKEAQ